MAKLLILAASLFFSSKTGVSSVGTTTSPQQQNPQAGADKDPCEVLFSMLYPRLFTTKSHVLHLRCQKSFSSSSLFGIVVCNRRGYCSFDVVIIVVRIYTVKDVLIVVVIIAIVTFRYHHRHGHRYHHHHRSSSW